MSRRDALLREMGLAPLWRLRESPAPAEGPAAEAPALGEEKAGVEASVEANQAAETQAVPPAAGDGSPDWDTLIDRIRHCTACRLCQGRKQAVPGVGDRRAEWLFVGEGPGAEEDARGEPFVGQAGRLLDNMLASIGLARGDNVYIANAVKCRPPNNRTPEAEEIAACHPYLERQISLIAPRLIIALGRPAAQALLDREVKIGAARGQTHARNGIPVIVTYHPAYLLRNLHDKAKAWEDLCFARRTMARLKAADAAP
jgi:uracil-DNA glycosylase family 4